LDGKLESFRSTEDIKVVTGGNIAINASAAGTVTEGTYIVEVGQFNTDTTLEVKVTLFTAGGSNSVTTTYTNGEATIGGVSITWDTTVFDVNFADFGGALPSGEVVDSAVARVEAINTAANQLIFQIGSNEGHNMLTGIDDMSAGALGITTTSLDVTTQDAAERAIMVVDAAIHKVSSQRAALGAVQNRLEHTISNLGVAAENLTAAESRVRDADMAKEMMEFTKQQILLQSSMGMLAQANAQPQNVLQLLR
ncbi:flagellin, partial [Thermosipho melanesiensis]